MPIVCFYFISFYYFFLSAKRLKKTETLPSDWAGPAPRPGRGPAHLLVIPKLGKDSRASTPSPPPPSPGRARLPLPVLHATTSPPL